MSAESAVPQPTIVRKPAMRIVGFGRVFTWSNMHEIPELWGLAAPWLRTNTGTTPGEAFGAMYVPEPEAGDLGYIAGMDMTGDFVLTEGLSELLIPALDWAVFPHNGGLRDWPKTIDAINSQWLPESGYQRFELVPGAVSIMERYGPGFDPDRGLGDMECWLPLKS